MAEHRVMLEKWAAAAQLVELDRLNEALKEFEAIAQNARLIFNVGQLHLALHHYEEAISTFSESIQKDPFLAIGYFQRAKSFCLLKKYQNALSDYQQCQHLLLDNSGIDYSQLGMPYQLCRSEVYYNMALCCELLSCKQDSIEYLISALKWIKNDENSQLIYDALRTGHVNPTLFGATIHAIFHPSASKVKNLNRSLTVSSPNVLYQKQEGFQRAASDPIRRSLTNTIPGLTSSLTQNIFDSRSMTRSPLSIRSSLSSKSTKSSIIKRFSFGKQPGKVIRVSFQENQFRWNIEQNGISYKELMMAALGYFQLAGMDEYRFEYYDSEDLHVMTVGDDEDLMGTVGCSTDPEVRLNLVQKPSSKLYLDSLEGQMTFEELSKRFSVATLGSSRRKSMKTQ